MIWRRCCGPARRRYRPARRGGARRSLRSSPSSLAIPFVVSGRWGLLGVGLQQRPRAAPRLERVHAQRLRPRARTPAIRSGPHAPRGRAAAFPRIALGQAFIGRAARDRDPHRAHRARRRCASSGRRGGRSPRCSSPYLPGRLLLRAGGVQGDRRGAVRPRLRDRRCRGCAAPRAGPDRMRSMAPAARAADRDPLRLQLRRARLADRDRRPLGADRPRRPRALRRGGCWRSCERRATLAWVGGARRGRRAARPSSGPSASPSDFGKVAGSNTYGPVSPVEALGVWPAANYRLDAAGGAPMPALAAMIGCAGA